MLTPFLQYVAEGRIVRKQSDLSRYTFQEICDKIYLTFLTLSLLKNFSSTRNFVKSYATQTLTYGSFERVRSTANDLHNMLAVITGSPDIVSKLANKNVALALRQRLTFPDLAVKRYLRTFRNDYQFLTQIEQALKITDSDYRNLRRAISDYLNLDSRSKKITVTRLLQALRSKLPGTDIQRSAEEFSKKQKLELDNVVDAERSIAPGSSISPQTLNAYRVLVGAANVRRAKMAVDLAKRGIGIPAPFVSAYLPIMRMIDDIAEGGFAFVRLLQAIHGRAKTSKKK